MIVIKWLSGEARGFKDLLPTSLFAAEGAFAEVEHLVLWGNERHAAKCALHVIGTVAELDYGGAHESWNDKARMIIGRMRLTFLDKSRDQVAKVEWAEGAGSYQVEEGVAVENDSDLESAEGLLKLVTHLRRERDPLLRDRKLRETEAGGQLRCQACGEDTLAKYGLSWLYEVHHKIPLADGAQKTKLDALDVLCPNCHRAIHKLGLGMTVQQLHDHLNERQSAATSPSES